MNTKEYGFVTEEYNDYYGEMRMSNKFYTHRLDSISEYDFEELDDMRLEHINAMTSEGLNSKVDIALELAVRDLKIERLVEKLEEVANELKIYIDRENAGLKSRIKSTDIDPPDYADYQTVYEAMELCGKTNRPFKLSSTVYY